MFEPNTPPYETRTTPPYETRTTRSLLALKNNLEREGELVPFDLLAVLGERGVIV